MITVCSACFRVSCLHGEICDDPFGTGTVERSKEELLKMNLEHPSWLNVCFSCGMAHRVCKCPEAAEVPHHG